MPRFRRLPAADVDHARGLRSDARRESWRLLGLCSPAVLLVTAIVLIPTGWLLWLSFIGESGDLSTENYRRLIEEGAYDATILTTFEISFVVAAMCILLGYPLAYLLAQLPRRAASLLMIAVLLPYWTSILVRTYAWLVLLQRNGLVNRGLREIGAIDEPLALVHNMTGTVIGMVHIMLPFLVLPLYASMQTIDRDYLKAAANLGASPTRAFWFVFFPLSLPGLFAGVLLVFVLCLGFYVTPAVMGGGSVIMIAHRIEKNVALYTNWGAASALGVVLLALTLSVLLLAHRFLGRAAAGTR